MHFQLIIASSSRFAQQIETRQKNFHPESIFSNSFIHAEVLKFLIKIQTLVWLLKLLNLSELSWDSS